MLINIPVFTISEIESSFDPKTTAFGGVATGSIKAHDAAKVVPTRSRYGWMPTSWAKGIMTGNNMAVVAILDEISVMKFTAVITSSTTTTAWVIEMELNWSQF